ncbi:hypothetical protein INR49_011636 [Caranx melampygus]|nr:hypothetical protein INR49_011636 [Caranx melampygus]
MSRCVWWSPRCGPLNSGDCFLLVAPHHCFLWSGEFASEPERAKVPSGWPRSSRATGTSLSGPPARAPGGGAELRRQRGLRLLEPPRRTGNTEVRGAGAPEEDEFFERGVVESNCVYRLVENRLVPHEQAWASIPSTALLSSTEALVFDFGSEVYLWLGQDVPPSRTNVALQLTHQVWAGAYDYSNCRVNPLDPTQSDSSIQL